MGFSIRYRSTSPVAPAQADGIVRDAYAACLGRSWLSCEPVNFHPDRDGGILAGSSKPNFNPHPDDAASAAQSGLPDGTASDLLDILCVLSKDHGVDWEIDHDEAPEPIGAIRAGACDESVRTQVDLLAEVAREIAGFNPDDFQDE